MSSLTTRSTAPRLSSVMFLLVMYLPLPTLLMFMHWIVFSYMQFTQSKLDMSVTISSPARSFPDFMSLQFMQPQLLLRLSMHSVNPTGSRSSRSLIYIDTYYLIPQTLLCLQEWTTTMMMTLLLQECKVMTLLLQECQYPS